MQYFEDIKNDLGKFDCQIEDESHIKRMRFKCDKNGNYPDFQFIINGYIFTIPKENAYFIKDNDKEHLYSKAIFINMPMYLIGSAFFHHFHILFDMDADDLKFYPINKDLMQKDGESNESNALSISLIVIGSIAFIAGVIFVVYFVFIKKKKKLDINLTIESLYKSFINYKAVKSFGPSFRLNIFLDPLNRWTERLILLLPNPYLQDLHKF